MLNPQRLEDVGLRQGVTIPPPDIVASSCGWYSPKGVLLGYGDLGAVAARNAVTDFGRGEFLLIVARYTDADGVAIPRLEPITLLDHTTYVLGDKLVRYVPASRYEELCCKHGALHFHYPSNMPVIIHLRRYLSALLSDTW